jgi:hypothetical protein
MSSKNVLTPKKLNNNRVIGRLAHGLASKKAMTEEIDAPFLYSSMDIAKIPWEHADMKKPNITE